MVPPLSLDMCWTPHVANPPRGTPSPLLSQPFDFIFAADCIYWESLWAPLNSTLIALTDANKSASVILAQLKRRKMESRFFRLVRKSFDVAPLPQFEKGSNACEGGGWSANCLRFLCLRFRES
jgi:hypothetical protein